MANVIVNWVAMDDNYIVNVCMAFRNRQEGFIVAQGGHVEKLALHDRVNILSQF